MDSSRRKFLQIAAGGIVAAGGLVGLAQGHADLPRPPGALKEDAFLSRCQRCMRCVDACQPGALHIGHLGDGIANIGTPVLDIDKCIQCMDCMRACPSGALVKVSKNELRMGVAVIDEKLCLTYRKKRRCKTCADACREFKAITVEKKGYPFPKVNAEKCTGCGACVRRCPEKDNHAIWLDLSKATHYDPPQDRMLARLESRTEAPNPILTPREWIARRVETLAKTYGLSK